MCGALPKIKAAKIRERNADSMQPLVPLCAKCMQNAMWSWLWCEPTEQFFIAKAFDQVIVNFGIFRILVCAYYSLQHLQVGVKTLAIRMRYCVCFATLVVYLIHVVPALFVLEGHLCVAR